MKILKKSKLIVLTLCTLLLTSFLGFSTSAFSNNLVINTGNIILGKVYYEDFSMMPKKITSSDGIGYCLEIDKDYPYNENFTHSGTVSPEVKNVIACGYPNKSPDDLNLVSDDDAYFATQIAIWSIVEGYDVSKITGPRPEIITAINTIYNNSLNLTNTTLDYDTNLFFTKDSIQDIVILSAKAVIPPVKPVEPVMPELPTKPELPTEPELPVEPEMPTEPELPLEPDVIPTPPEIDEYPIINGK